MDEHPALALREKKDSSILVAVDLVKRGEADAVVTAGHTGAGMAAAVPAPGPPARRRSPGARRPDDHRRGPDGPPRHRRQPGLDRRRTSSSTRRWARSSPSASWAWPGRASRCCRSARRRARATPGSSARPSCSTQTDLHFTGNVEGKDLTHHLADVVVCDAVLGNVVIKFFEGLSTFIFDLWRARVRAVAARAGWRTCSCAPASAGSGPSSTTRRSAARRCWACAARSSSPTAGPRRRMVDVRLRGGGDDGADRRPGTDRRVARGSAAVGTAGAAARPTPMPPGGVMNGPRADGRAGRHRRARPAGRLRGARRRPRSAGAVRRGAGCIGGPAVSVRIRDDRVLVRLWVVARPGQPLGTAHRPDPLDRGGDRRAPARPRPRGGHRAGRWRRGLTASAAGGPVAGWPSRPSSRRTSGSAPRTPSSSATWPRRSATRTPRRSPASSSPPRSRTATRSTRRSPAARRSTRSPASPGWTAPCSVAPYPRCYTRPRRPGWPSPSGSSWHAPTVENRCDA